MRVAKKLAAPYLLADPTGAILIINLVDPQINTTKSFIDACETKGMNYLVIGNKDDRVKRTTLSKTKKELREEILPISLKTFHNLPKLEKKINKFFKKGDKVMVLGVFNAGKTSLINYLCKTSYKVGDLPGTTLEFTETPYNNLTLIDSVGQLIDINKPLMVSIDFNGCRTIESKIERVFKEEQKGLTDTLESSKEGIVKTARLIMRQIKKGKKVIVTGAGASALVAREMAGQGLETGLPIMVFTNDLADSQPVSFAKGLGEEEGGLARYAGFAINKGDVVIGISASGGTGFVYEILRQAKKKKAITVAITENIDTPLGKQAKQIIKSNAKPEGPSSSKIQIAHLAIVHAINLIIADERGVTADDSVQFMLPEKVETKKMGIK
ncbi:MAG TPA: SIS domain-containing protein [Patescibacteria group bacterium]|nr:SIS domain-containing protein [Patescibacteria group bacterium]